MAFPGLPVYTSRDLVTWNLASHVWDRESQLPGLSWRTPGQTNGMYAATIRHHEGVYYVVCAYLGLSDKPMGVLFNTTNPVRSSQWSDPIILDLSEIDPDLFWDDGGKTYLTTAGITLQEINLETGQLGEASNIWNGTSNEWPDGSHIYKKDAWYFLLIAEGGTSQKHAVSITDSKEIKGPYMAYERNPILTNRDTSEYFQSVGHADLFQDSNGHWWGLCLAIRTGPSYQYMPMRREAVLFNVTWNREEWPKLEPRTESQQKYYDTSYTSTEGLGEDHNQTGSRIADDSKYFFTAMSMAALGPRVVIGTVTTSAVSGRGGSGFFVGSILGTFSTCNVAGFGKECPQGGDLLIKTWVYTGVAQKISSVEIIPMSGPTSY
ncbi:Non-reducing end alpha-L-arabinofuranosidase BoGH43A [Fusarium oxysporum f. sp. raphani]|uniref:Non-reducing end alpha-L-arabinofuranosidase BoGH43A n=1 Tax=Fusarium oxysporum f. sp. raphani TaxID=96318 RepID=A0A8J5QDK8_FUSOX|nr:Non-reducing end alpha-L-arabinofuranosidase BoGH43A [Fusarium oxysporum f. sp. raphani]